MKGVLVIPIRVVKTEKPSAPAGFLFVFTKRIPWEELNSKHKQKSVG
jgi:hypothetical protein